MSRRHLKFLRNNVIENFWNNAGAFPSATTFKNFKQLKKLNKTSNTFTSGTVKNALQKQKTSAVLSESQFDVKKSVSRGFWFFGDSIQFSIYLGG